MQRRTPFRSAKIRSLRAEAGLLTLAGAILLGIGLPIVLVLALLAASPSSGMSPWLPPIVGGPLILLGYGVCAYAAQRLAEAKKLEAGTQTAPRKKQLKPVQQDRSVSS